MSSESRNSAFQQLKPHCIALNQAVLLHHGRQAQSDLVQSRLEALIKALRDLKPYSLDSRVAEYVFVPLASILRTNHFLSLRVSELTFRCLAILLSDGWQDKVAGPLGTQLMILLSITGDTSEKSKLQKPSEELLHAVLDCLSALFRGLAASAAGRAQILDDSTSPHLGHVITIVLGGLESQQPPALQVSALCALQAVLDSLEDHEVLASFLPGIVSSLTKILAVNSKNRRSWKVLSQSLDILTSMIVRAVGDVAVTHILAAKDELAPSSRSKGKSKLNKSWIEATAGQLKLALAGVSKLLHHDRTDVRVSLAKLHYTVLYCCSTSLSNCLQISMETLIVLLDSLERGSRQELDFVILLQQKDGLRAILEDILCDWSQAMTRILESADEDKKMGRMRNLFAGHRYLRESGTISQIALHTSAEAIPDYISTILRSSRNADTTAIVQQNPESKNLSPLSSDGADMRFQPVLAMDQYSINMLALIQSEVRSLEPSDTNTGMFLSIVDQVRETEDDQKLALFWLSLRIAESGSAADVDDFLVLPTDRQSLWRDDLRDDLYDLALSTISDDSTEWRMQALSLECIAMQAVATRSDFRTELIDVLYPVLHLLGSREPRVQEHAKICVNIIASASGYEDVRDLVVSNADYLVNAVALRLNAFDVSPQGPQVLLMMIKLAGPALIPYLEDTVQSIFAILEDYHGYTKLVELLFAVLKAIIDQGTREPRLQIEAPSSADSYPVHGWSPSTIASLADYLNQRQIPKPPVLAEPAPAEVNVEEDESTPPTVHSLEKSSEIPQPKGKTYPLMQRIVGLTAHYLPSSSPSLRGLLLDLLADSLPTIAVHENTFLPLIHTLWPGIVGRLYDEHLAVVARALDVISGMCTLAGGFMKTRLREIWPALKAVHARISSTVTTQGSAARAHLSDKKTKRLDGGDIGAQQLSVAGGIAGQMRHARYVDPSTQALWTSLKRTLLAAVEHVGLSEEAVEDILRMLAPLGLLEERERDVLERENGDAVWLAQWRAEPDRSLVPERLRRSKHTWAGVTPDSAAAA